VYIFESIYDRLSSGLKNSVAVLGSNLHEDRIKELKTPVFCLDNTLVDEKAKEETIKYLKQGYKALIWPNGSEKFKDTNDLRKIGVPYEKISKMILNNIHQGIAGTIRAKMII
jgi:DNA primase